MAFSRRLVDRTTTELATYLFICVYTTRQLGGGEQTRKHWLSSHQRQRLMTIHGRWGRRSMPTCLPTAVRVSRFVAWTLLCNVKPTVSTVTSTIRNQLNHSHFSERELMFTFATWCRPSVRLSSVTLVRPTQAVQIFGNISTAFGTLAIRWHPRKIFMEIVAGDVPLRRGS